MSDTTALITAEEVSSIPPEQGKEEKAGMISLEVDRLSSKFEELTFYPSQGFFHPSQASKTAAEPSSIPQQGKEKAGKTSHEEFMREVFPPARKTPHEEFMREIKLFMEKFVAIPDDISSYKEELDSVKYLPPGHPKQEAFLERVRTECQPPPRKSYAIELDTEWYRESGKFDYFKEEAIRFLEGNFGSSGAERFLFQVKRALGNVFVCRLRKEEVLAVRAKHEVVSVWPLSEEGRVEGGYTGYCMRPA